MATVGYMVATVLFLVAWLLGGVHATAGDLVTLGLALFAAAHMLPAAIAWPPPRQ
jgi:hypothetical protein